MNADDLPKFDPKRTYMLSGKTLNLLVAVIKANQILSIQGGSVERTPNGVIIRVK